MTRQEQITRVLNEQQGVVQKMNAEKDNLYYYNQDMYDIENGNVDYFNEDVCHLKSLISVCKERLEDLDNQYIALEMEYKLLKG